MSRTAPATTKYGGLVDVLADKTFYRITSDGRQASEDAWRNPYTVNYPEYKHKGKYYTPTGRPRGRPRVERGRRRRVERVGAEREVTEVLAEMARPAEARPEPVRERKRRLRIPVSQQIESELPALRERIVALRVSRDLAEVDALEATMLRLFDRAIDAVDEASGEERERLSSIVRRLETAPEGYDDVRAGIKRRNEVTLQRGIETLLLCCPS